MNSVETIAQLKIHLTKLLNQNGEAKPVYLLIDRLVDNVRRIPPEIRVNIVRTLFYPLGSRALDNNSQGLALKMVKLMNWWLQEKQPRETPAKGLLELVRERRIIVSMRQANGQIRPM